MPRKARLAEARARITQLAERLAELRAGIPVSEADLISAAHHASVAAARANHALISSAAAHERTACGHDMAAAHNCGDVAAHGRAAIHHRAARDADIRAAEASRTG
jgi:hypothetical protein